MYITWYGCSHVAALGDVDLHRRMAGIFTINSSLWMCQLLLLQAEQSTAAMGAFVIRKYGVPKGAT